MHKRGKSLTRLLFQYSNTSIKEPVATFCFLCFYHITTKLLPLPTWNCNYLNLFDKHWLDTSAYHMQIRYYIFYKFNYTSYYLAPSRHLTFRGITGSPWVRMIREVWGGWVETSQQDHLVVLTLWKDLPELGTRGHHNHLKTKHEKAYKNFSRKKSPYHLKKILKNFSHHDQPACATWCSWLATILVPLNGFN